MLSAFTTKSKRTQKNISEANSKMKLSILCDGQIKQDFRKILRIKGVTYDPEV